MLITGNIGLAIVFGVLTVIFFVLLGVCLCDTKERIGMTKERSDTLCFVNKVLRVFAVCAGIFVAILPCIILEMSTGWLIAFLVVLGLIVVIMATWFWFNGMYASHAVAFALAMIAAWLMMYDVMQRLGINQFWYLAACFPIASIGFGIAKAVRDYGEHLEDQSEGEEGKGIIAVSTGLFTLTIVALVAVLLVGILSNGVFRNPKTTGAQQIAGTEAPDQDDIKEAIDALTVAEVTEKDLQELELNKFKFSSVVLQSSLSTKDASRTESTGFSDALTFGFKSKNEKGMLKEAEEEIFRNPIYAQTLAKAFKDKKIGNTSIGKINPWMVELANTKWYKWCVKEGEGADMVLRVKREYQYHAAEMCLFLERFVIKGVQKYQTIENWCLNLSIENSKREGIKADYQYKKEALIFAYVPKSKMGTKDLKGLFIFGLNIHDKRPEFYGEEKTPKTKDTTSNRNTPSKPGGSNNPKSTPTDPPESTPTDPPESMPDYDKDPADDPVNNGNADKGGGDNESSDGSGDYQEDDPRDETHGPVTPPTPTVVPEHSHDDIVDDENPMTYDPDPVTDRGPVNGGPATSEDGDGEFTPPD